MSRQARLVYSLPDGEQETLLDPVRETTIGRHPACTITVAQPSVSRKHARLWFEGGGYYVEDLGSSNGTYLNNQRVTRASLAAGDDLRCGDFKLKYEEISAGGGTREVPSPARAPNPAPAPKQSAPRVVGTLRPRRRPSNSPRASADRPAQQPHRPAPQQQQQPRPVGRLSKARASVVPSSTPEPAASAPPPRVSVEPRKKVEPASSGVDQAELERLRKEVTHWKAQAEGRALLDENAAKRELAEVQAKVIALEGEVDGARAARDEAQAALGDLQADVEDRGRRIAELESAKLRAEEQLDTQADRSLQLKDQVHAQQEQLEEYRREKAGLEMQLAETKQHVEELETVRNASKTREDELADMVNDLKREVRQQQKQHKEVEQQLELIEYDLRAAREENENLRLALGEDDSARKGLNVTIDHLRQVLSEKEGMIERLQAEVRRLEDQLRQAEDRASEDAGSQIGRLRAEVETLRAENETLRGHEQRHRNTEQSLREEVEGVRAEFTALRSERDALQARLREAERAVETAKRESSAPSGRIMTQLNELKRENRDLRNALDAAQAGGGEGDGARLAQLQDALEKAGAARRDAERETQTLRDQVRRLEAGGGGGGGDFAGLKREAVRTYETLNDIASELRMSVEVAEDMVKELRPVAKGDADAEFTAESAEDNLRTAHQRANEFKKAMRAFRDVLERHGYGD